VTKDDLKAAARWRLIQHDAASGTWNMAVDEALLEGARQSGVPVLRFYGWEPACISLGRLQKVPPSLHKSTFDWVRRPTGGRAVLHQHEITYCAAIPETSLARPHRSVLGAYQWLSQGFITGLQELGVTAALAPAHRGKRLADNCFSAPAQCDFVVDGRKLIGAAQCRRHGVILQHGAILVHINAQSWQTALGSAMNSAISLRELGVQAEAPEVTSALIAGLETRHGIHFDASALSGQETAVATKLHRTKYSQSSWNQQGKEPAAAKEGGNNS